MRLPPPLVTGCRGGMVVAHHPSLDAQQLCQRRGAPASKLPQVKITTKNTDKMQTVVCDSWPCSFSAAADVPLTKIIFWHSLVTYIQLLKLLDL